MDLRDRIRQRLDALGLSDRAGSLKAGLSTHFLQKLFSDPDKSLTVDNLEKLADALETTAEWLLSGREELKDQATAEVLNVSGLIRDQRLRTIWLETGRAMAKDNDEEVETGE